MTYATNRLYEEVAYVAYYFHWSLDEILELEHPVTSSVRRGDRPDKPVPVRRVSQLWGFWAGFSAVPQEAPDRR